MENEFAELTLNEEEDAVLQAEIKLSTKTVERVFRLVGCFLTVSVILFPAMRNTMVNLWHPVTGVQI
ncbi:hypothetical protein Gorai_023324 [Gossypium raimondii]|uniref:Uncharacterized protein n=1 Tax=Gossypium raimondii TaxID=29730 RepID=A0A7J8NW39_GOSRA|nr:hypothetical protein [Gossypium raimondii]